jgi:predicted CoA-binding protein
MSLPDSELRALLAGSRTIAVVGHSDKPYRTSYQIAQYLRRVGYRVYAVNPTLATIDGQPSYPSVAAVPEPVDLVHPQAEARARAAGLVTVVDRCIMVEHRRLVR